MILMNTVWNFPVPHSNSAKFRTAPISLNKQNVSWLKPVRVHLSGRHIDFLDLAKIQITLSNISDTQIGSGMLTWTICRALLNAVGNSRKFPKAGIWI